MKPFFSKKCYRGEQKIVLCENDKNVNNTKDVTECFNNFFSTVANSIGKDVNYDPLQHPSIVEIKRKMEIESEKSFVFQKVTEEKVEKIVNNINIKKGTGVDGIPAKVVKNCKEAIIPNLTLLINLSVEHCIFPDRLKQAQVTPLLRRTIH